MVKLLFVSEHPSCREFDIENVMFAFDTFNAGYELIHLRYSTNSSYHVRMAFNYRTKLVKRQHLINKFKSINRIQMSV